MSQLRGRHAKILATIGPASRNIETLREMVKSGVDIIRLNFSHGSHDDHRTTIENLRAVEKELGRRVTILQDLQGPKIRLGTFHKAPILLTEGDIFTLDSDPEPGDQTRCQLPHPEILEVLKEGDKIYINDGLVRLVVSEVLPTSVICTVTVGGKVSDRKGVNLPGVDLPISSITPKDWKDLEFGIKMNVDWVAVSFVQRPDDIEIVKKHAGDKVAVIAKIEMPNAVERIDSILAVSDAIMVARGDLGVEMPIEEVPSIQKRLIRLAREAGKPVVVATQMLESMITNPTPTRAEVSDVANATFEGADALMLSAESAAGDYPIEAIRMMDSIIRRSESSSAWQPLMDARHMEPREDASDAITYAAFNTATLTHAKAIVTLTESGSTALRMARQRPVEPHITITPHEKIARRLGLVWGVNTVIMNESPSDHNQVIEQAQLALKEWNLYEANRNIVLTAGLPYGHTGSTNILRILTLD